MFGDYRGYFMETYNRETFASLGIHNDWCRTTSPSPRRRAPCGAFTSDGPHGPVQDRPGNPGRGEGPGGGPAQGQSTYKKWVLVELSAENKRMLYIPRGFGHGFVTLTDDVEFVYKVDNLYSKDATAPSATTTGNRRGLGD